MTISVTGVLDLQARIHLEEEEVAAIVGDELARARADVADLLHDAERRLVERGATGLTRFAGEERGGRRRLLDDLLMSPLHAALALAEGKRLAVGVAEDLHLDVPRLRDVALEVDARVREARLAAIGARFEGALDAGLVLHDLHADAAAAADRLHDHGVADAGRDLLRVGDALDGVDRDRLVGSRAPGSCPPRARRGAPSSCRRTHRARPAKAR